VFYCNHSKPTSLFVDVFPINETVNKFSRIQQWISIKKTIKEIVKIGDFVYNPKYTSHNYQSGPADEKEIVAFPVGPEEYFEEVEGLITTGKIHVIWTL
jgi:hypothetical protein